MLRLAEPLFDQPEGSPGSKAPGKRGGSDCFSFSGILLGAVSSFASKFNGEYDQGSVLVCRFLHASTGLNLTGGKDGVANIIFVEPPDDASSLNQAIKRVHRVGNVARSVSIHVL